MEQEELIRTLRVYFDSLDKSKHPDIYGDDAHVFVDLMRSENKLRTLVLTENDNRALSRLSEYGKLKDYFKASEDLIPLCETTSAKKIIIDFETQMYHMEEARNGDL